MEKIEWDKKLSVDIPEIDELQKKMFALINALIDLMERNAEGKECANMISEISEYSKYYFSIEEEYLKKNKYPEFADHSKMHRKFELFVMKKGIGQPSHLGAIFLSKTHYQYNCIAFSA